MTPNLDTYTNFILYILLVSQCAVPEALSVSTLSLVLDGVSLMSCCPWLTCMVLESNPEALGYPIHYVLAEAYIRTSL